jgi:ABC transporter DrrB family efflux protein
VTTAVHPQHEHAGFAREDLSPPSYLGSCLLVVRRNLIHIKRMPELLLDVTIQPVMFVLLFAFVFGAAINVPGTNYREYLIPGIMAQTMIFSSFIVAIGLVNDLEKGFVDRLKSLPIHRASILVGRSLSSLIHSSIGITVMAVTGLTIGWGIHTSVAEGVAGFALMLGMGFAMIWVGILVGSTFRSVEGAQGFMFVTSFPLTFLSNAFVPTVGMAGWLRVIAEWNPVSALVQATRELWGNGPVAPPGAALPLHHPELFTVGWVVLITAVMAPLSVRAFWRRSRD